MTISNYYSAIEKSGKGSGIFYFKHFRVRDSHSTMKVGTDAVLLGATADPAGARNILEIGTGCGVIALILAQRSDARIDAIEIDKESAGQAEDNARESPWHDRIEVKHISFQDFIKHTPPRYDLIISNPPFFSGSLRSPEKKRNISRHDDLLSFDELINGSARLMLPGGSLWVILPEKESGQFTEIATISGLFIHFILKIIPKRGNKPHRMILQLKKAPVGRITEESLTILNIDLSYTSEYMEVMKDLYLNF